MGLSKRYYEYMASPEWNAKKTAKRKRKSGRVCGICGDNRSTDMHHHTYKRFGDERLRDLQPLCRECHSFLHVYCVATGQNRWKAYRHIRRKIRKIAKSWQCKRFTVARKVFAKPAKWFRLEMASANDRMQKGDVM